MSSGSLKDVIKAVNSIVPGNELKIPWEAQEVFQAYLDKHTPIDWSDSGKLHDELISIWQKQIKENPERYPLFLRILRELRPAIRGDARWLQWWDALVIPVLGNMSGEKGLASQCRKLLLAIMIFEPEDKDIGRIESAKATSKAIAEKILEIWLKKSGIATAEANPIAKYMEDQIKIVLMELGRRKPQELFSVLNKYFIQSRYRNQVTTLLVELLGQDAPHLHVMKETPLFDSLLRCLQLDTSTTVISQAMTALTMFLPHIPVSSGGYLPALFNIYTRMLLWKKYKDPSAQENQGSEDDEDDASPPSATDSSWEKLEYSGDQSDESLPDILHYFTFLYGLYPYNLMAYIRKPSKWRKAWVNDDKNGKKTLGGYEIEVEPHEIQERSKAFQSQHLLHPHFLSHNIETEISDAERWRQHAASDVATFCMELLQPLADDVTQPATPSFQQHQEFSRTFELRRGERGLLTRTSSHETFHTNRSQDPSKEGITSNPTSGLSSRHMSAIISPDGTGEFSQLARLSSRNSHSASINADVVSPGTVTDSGPEISPGTGPIDAVASLEGMLASQHSVRSNLRHSIRNDSSTTLSSFADTSHHTNANVDTYLASLPPQSLHLSSLNQQPPRSPSLRPTTMQSDPNSTIASLQRDVTLLKNALSFERYLKQQHFSHIGRLRRQAIREAVAESETQNLLNENKKLKLEVKREKEAVGKVKKEADLSRGQSRKWEADVTAKLRAIKEEQKKWLVERDGMKAEMETLKNDNEGMKQLIIQSEEREHHTGRQLKSIEIELESLQRLRDERDKLKHRLRKFLQEEKAEEEKEAERKRQDSRIGLLEMQLEAKERELEECRLAATSEIEQLNAQLSEANSKAKKEVGMRVQEMIDTALDATRRREDAAKKLVESMRMRKIDLERENLRLREELSRATEPKVKKAINMNPLEPYVAAETTVGEGDGMAVARPSMGKTQSTPALTFRAPTAARFDGHSLGMAGGGGRVLSDASPSRQRDERRSNPALARGHTLDPAAIGMGGVAEGGPSNMERAKSPKSKGERSGLMFGRGRSLYDSVTLGW